ncbi:MAG: CTP--2,3-di-O-geranylgeranyl-sn-glycero-1-phosphate cytidyltransferase, partial [Nanoarchaeota archaeon]|nr:CTP--2,3-di-O-geranylgeranyl-sn-glycero-1-phosphate cytidyltransferase [Nanoarchaeota archaeon]
MWTFTHELGRKAVHLSILLVIFGYYLIEQTFGKQLALLALVGLLILFLIFEFFRLELDMTPPFFEQFIRPKERTRPYGVIYFLSGTIISLAVFDFKIAFAALLMTTFGDMGAALIGKRYGKTIIFKNKTVSGGLTELTINLFVGFVILSNIYI